VCMAKSLEVPALSRLPMGEYSLSFFFQADDGIRDAHVIAVQTCALPICQRRGPAHRRAREQGLDADEAERLVPLGRVPQAARARQQGRLGAAVHLADVLHGAREARPPAAGDDQAMTGALRGFDRPVVALGAVQLTEEQVVLLGALRKTTEHVV